MDLANYSTKKKSADGEKMPIIDINTKDVIKYKAEGDEKPQEMFVTLKGPSDPKTKREFAKVRNRMNNRPANFIPSDDTLAAEEEHDARMLAELTVDGLVFFEGGWVDMTSENSYPIYKKSDVLRAQCFDFINDPKNFV